MKDIRVGDLVQPTAYAKRLKTNPTWVQECFLSDSYGYVVANTNSTAYPFKVCWFPTQNVFVHGFRELKKAKLGKNAST